MSPSPHSLAIKQWGKPLLIVLLVVMWILPGAGGIMHETDQAAVLDGGWRLSSGEWQGGKDFYDYDKLFVSYWVLAAVFWAARHVSTSPDVVLIGNLTSSAILLLGFIAILRRRRLSSRAFMALIAVTLAPTYLMHAPFFAAAFVSSGFLMMLYAAVRQPFSRRPAARVVLAVGLTFAAVGARADAVLVLPFLVWLTLCPMPRPWGVFKRPLLYWMIAAAGAALAVGKWLQPENGVYGFPPLVRGKIFAAYVVFGLGGSVFVIGWLGAWAIGAALASRGIWRRLSWTFGALSFAAPFVYYAGQLFSTRYWMTGLTATLLFVVSRRGRALSQNRGGREVARWIMAAAVAAAVVPLFIGVRLPFPTKPRLVFRNATAFPSTDGMIPMGTFLAFHFWPGSAEALQTPDHNEAIWRSARTADFKPDEKGAVPLLETPMAEILKLAVNVQGKKFRLVERLDEPCYSDSRSLIRVAPAAAEHWRAGSDPSGAVEDSVAGYLKQVASSPASEFYRGIAIFRLEPTRGGKAEGDLAAWEFLREIYSGNEFRVRPVEKALLADGFINLPIRDGKTLVIAAGKPFKIQVKLLDGMERETSSEPLKSHPEMNVVILNGEQSNVASLRFSASQPAPETPILAEAVLPDYMSVQAFKR